MICVGGVGVVDLFVVLLNWWVVSVVVTSVYVKDEIKCAGAVISVIGV